MSMVPLVTKNMSKMIIAADYLLISQHIVELVVMFHMYMFILWHCKYLQHRADGMKCSPNRDMNEYRRRYNSYRSTTGNIAACAILLDMVQTANALPRQEGGGSGCRLSGISIAETEGGL